MSSLSFNCIRNLKSSDNAFFESVCLIFPLHGSICGRTAQFEKLDGDSKSVFVASLLAAGGCKWRGCEKKSKWGLLSILD